jgi:uncharacterized protein YbjT (DUF2867 family)
MKYVLLGSIGNITKPIALNLIKAGHQVSLISSNEESIPRIEAIGATPLVGNVADLEFLTRAFEGADALYLMIPPKWSVENWIEYLKSVSDNYANAITANGIKQVVVLSSVGAHMKNGAGPIDGLAYLEGKLNELPDVNAVYLRPSYFYYNIYSMIPLIKNAGIMGGAQPASHKMVLTDTSDIAEVATEVLLKPDFKGKSVRYIASDEQTWADITKAISEAIEKPDLPWVEFTDEQSLDGMLKAGLNPSIAEGYVAMGNALRSGEMEADYLENKPKQLGKVKLEDFVKQFAEVYKMS